MLRENQSPAARHMPSFVDGERYEKQKFSRLIARGQRFSRIEFEGCVFQGCIFAECTFYRCGFHGCRFESCDLSVINVPNSRFIEVQFHSSKLVGVDWTKAGDQSESKLPLSVGFSECVLNLSNFAALKLKGSAFTRCTARDVDFADADLSECDCRGSDFADSKFLHTNLSKADLREATGYAINPTTNNIKKAKFSLPEALTLLAGFDVEIE
jgi:uncharacterized protein YjbI with pentapeptide repeats